MEDNYKKYIHQTESWEEAKELELKSVNKMSKNIKEGKGFTLDDKIYAPDLDKLKKKKIV